MKNYKHFFLIFICTCFAISVKAIVRPNIIFSDNMVLQRGVEVPIWGTANTGEKVSIEFRGQKYNTIAKEGKWLFKLKPLKAGGPFVMEIKGENTISISNILVGEVWLCSGQSNMEMLLGPVKGRLAIENAKEAIANAINYPTIREFTVARDASNVPLTEVKKGRWNVCDSVTVKKFSAVGYFFANTLSQKLNVPIGLIHSSFGGTGAERWTSREVLESNPELKALVTKYEKAIVSFPERFKKYKENEVAIIEAWKKEVTLAKENNKALPKKPIAPVEPAKSGDCGGLFNALIAPIIPYAIKGVIWYQGEHDSNKAKTSKEYQTLFPALISDWRSRWQQGDFPFLYVQIAPNERNTPELREAQLLTLQRSPNTAMAVITECVDPTFDIHSPIKKPVGDRLALAARALAYNEKIEYMGPIYESMKIEGNTIRISFTHIGTGLVAKESDLIGFTIAGTDANFVPAKAIIEGNTIVVSAANVIAPVNVRFGFINIPITNLYNKEGLPASPFRTDVP